MAPDLSSVSPKARSWIYGGAGISWMGRSRSTDTWKDKGWRDPQQRVAKHSKRVEHVEHVYSWEGVSVPLVVEPIVITCD